MMRKRYECKPLYIAIISWFGTLGSFVVSEVFIRMVGWHGLVPIIVAALTISSMVSPVVAMIMVGRSFNANANSIKGIVFLYLGAVILCGNIDFSIMLHCGLSGPAPFTGIHSVWGAHPDGRPPVFEFRSALLSAVDCLHFSVETLSTAGYGDISPTTWYSKLAIDVETLIGLAIVVPTLGKYFSQTSSRG
jgi:hypothetical protein